MEGVQESCCGEAASITLQVMNAAWAQEQSWTCFPLIVRPCSNIINDCAAGVGTWSGSADWFIVKEFSVGCYSRLARSKARPELQPLLPWADNLPLQVLGPRCVSTSARAPHKTSQSLTDLGSRFALLHVTSEPDSLIMQLQFWCKS